MGLVGGRPRPYLLLQKDELLHCSYVCFHTLEKYLRVRNQHVFLGISLSLHFISEFCIIKDKLDYTVKIVLYILSDTRNFTKIQENSCCKRLKGNVLH